MDERDLPTGRLGRFARLASTGLRAGVGVLIDKDARAAAMHTAEVLGTLRGLAAKVGQMASYVDGVIPEGQREHYEVAMKGLRAATPRSSPSEVRALITAERPEVFYAEPDPVRPWRSRAAVKAWRDDVEGVNYATVWADGYRGRCDYARFRADYLRLGAVFPRAAARMVDTFPRHTWSPRARVLDAVTPEVLRDRLIDRSVYPITRQRARAFERGGMIAEMLAR